MFIYKITNKINGKCYVGQTTKAVEDRFYEHKAKIGLGNRGKKHSDQARANVSAGRRGIRPNRSYKVSEDKKIKISEAGKKLWGAGKLNHLMEHNKKTRKPVTCIETGVDYISLSEAASAFNTTSSSISSMIRGRRKSINGFTFKYKEPYEQI
jgi:predicted GIY-YIG superfamily endonuclease